MAREVSLFGGAAGRVLWGTVSLHSLITGLALGFVLAVGNGVLFYAKAHILVTPFTQVVLAFALARFVLNGQYGEWRGSFLSGAGGTWATVSVVASRYLLLTCLWVVPMMLLGLRIEQAAISSAMPGGPTSVLATLYLVAFALSPPMLLIVSVTASDFGELFSPTHWKRVFGGRLVDLLSVYVVYAGGVSMAALLALPLIMLGFQPSWKFGVFCLALAGCFMLGLCLNLLGRLCGFYALGDFADPVEAESAHQPVATLPSSPVPVMPSSPVVSAAPKTRVSTAVLPALLDAAQRIDPILKRFKQDPGGALRALDDLSESFAPHPQVLVALCVCRHRNGDVERAVQLAQTVVPICFERGHVQLAAQVFKQLRRESERLGLNREQILTIGDALLKKGDLAGSGAAYSTAIGRDPGETRAVKGLLQIAGVYMNERGKPEAALKAYDYLLKHCSDSPLTEFMREGRAHCRRQLAQPVG